MPNISCPRYKTKFTSLSVWFTLKFHVTSLFWFHLMTHHINDNLSFFLVYFLWTHPYKAWEEWLLLISLSSLHAFTVDLPQRRKKVLLYFRWNFIGADKCSFPSKLFQHSLYDFVWSSKSLHGSILVAHWLFQGTTLFQM